MKYVLTLLISAFWLTCEGYELSICAIFQNDARYLKEWIEFHRIQGVEHFYLYDNLSTDNPEITLSKYIEDDIVTLIPWPRVYDEAQGGQWNSVQCGSYLDCLSKYGEESKWIAFLD